MIREEIGRMFRAGSLDRRACSGAGHLRRFGGGADARAAAAPPATAHDSGVNKTYLSVEASDADGDTLQYQWRVTGGSIDNRNASSTVWTMPASRGIHFAYVTISDGRGGYVEQQYAVNGDNARPAAAGARRRSSAPRPRSPTSTARPPRLRFVSRRRHPVPAGRRRRRRRRARSSCPTSRCSCSSRAPVPWCSAARTDLSGELDLPKLVAGTAYTVRCTAQNGTPLAGLPHLRR